MILKTTEEILGALERGNLAKDVAEALRQVAGAIYEQDGGSGSVTLKFGLKGKGDMVTVTCDLAVKTPKTERRATNFFVTPDGRLSLQHPQQIDMGFADRGRIPTTIDG